MTVTNDQVAAMIRQSFGGVTALAQHVGQAEGGGVQAQHAAALQFWQTALALTGDDALTRDEAAFAQAEVDRHTQALVPPPLAPRRRGEPV